MDGTVFFYVGGALVLAALVLSFVGIRGKASFPANGPQYTAVIGAFALLVAVTGAYAVANAREEQEHREEELAHESEEVAEEAGALEREGSDDAGASSQAQQGEEEGAAGAGLAGPGQSEGGPTPGETLDLTSPEDGGLAFEPDGLEAQAGTITLAYENPSQVPHNVAIEDTEGQVLGEGEVLAQGTSEATAELAPGEYTFFCAVPGHREGGMEGTLTVAP